MHALLLLALSLSPLAHADDAPDKVVKYRQTIMGGLSKHMSAAAMIAKAEVARPDDMKAHAQGLVNYAKLVKGLFPEGTGPDKVASESKPEVWTDRAAFDKAADELVAKSEAFLKATESGDVSAAMAAFGQVGRSCGGCHDDFKVDDD
jgi:cytochrome c556